ncbi:unnamed protein product [Callosobruchus maculatus]|uniref:Uncharacterized protein n=1 Tax=Callosobruchus maculatus TaxID=64391 RepID=A0A653DYX7_CALMS|nr:unnamed protein product [Callosobruchus maculatus]
MRSYLKLRLDFLAITLYAKTISIQFAFQRQIDYDRILYQQEIYRVYDEPNECFMQLPVTPPIAAAPYILPGYHCAKDEKSVSYENGARKAENTYAWK